MRNQSETTIFRLIQKDKGEGETTASGILSIKFSNRSVRLNWDASQRMATEMMLQPIWTMTAAVFLTEMTVSMVSSSEPNGFFEPIQPTRQVQVVTNRGLHDAAPVNSRRSWEMCVQDYHEWIKLDVRLTKDGKHVVFDNEQVNERSNGTGKVSELTLAELKQLDIGSWFASRFKDERVQTLREVLSWAKEKINLRLNCGVIDPTLFAKEVLDAGMENQVVAFAEAAVLSKIDRAAKGKIRLMARWSPEGVEPNSFVLDHSLSTVEIQISYLTPENCKAFKKLGVKVQADTVGPKWDTPENWLKAAEAGADQILTDEPLRVLTTLFRRKHPKWPVSVAFHRGANRYAPENTLPAITLAADLQADYIEIDIRTTKDGKNYLLHDRSFDRTTKRKGPFAGTISSEIDLLEAGSWFGAPFAKAKVPTLDEALTAMGERSNAYLDCKDISPTNLAKVLRERKFLNRSAVCQSVEYLTELKRIEPNARGMASFNKIDDFDKISALKPYAVDAKWTLLSKEMIQKCHESGIKVFSDALGWHETIKEYQQAIDWGIDLIQTDHPAKLLRAMELRLAGHK